jgi:ABC-type nitrate/sulfonate/bicarbonate transport system substrate-binding protein
VVSLSIKDTPADTPPIRIAVSKTPLSAPVYIADEMGFFDQYCSSVSLNEVVGGKRSFETMVSGQADFSTSSDSVVVFKTFNRQDFSVLASFVQSDNDVKVVSREDSKLTSARSLKGKKVAVIKGTASEYFFTTYLALEGVDLSDIELVDMRPNEMPQALQNKQVDAIVPWEPYAYKAVQLLNDTGNVIPTKNLYTLSFNLISMKSFVNAHPEAAHCVLKAMNDAVAYISANPTETQRVISKRLGLDEGFIFWMWPDYIFKLSLNKSLLMNIESQAQWAMDNDMVGVDKMPDFMRVVDPMPLTIVVPAATVSLSRE